MKRSHEVGLAGSLLLIALAAAACGGGSDGNQLTSSQRAAGFITYPAVNGSCAQWAIPSEVLGDGLDELGRSSLMIAKNTAAAKQLTTFTEAPIDEAVVGHQAADKLRHLADSLAATANLNPEPGQDGCTANTGVSVSFIRYDSCQAADGSGWGKDRGEGVNVSYQLQKDGSLAYVGSVSHDLTSVFPDTANTIEQNRRHCEIDQGGVFSSELRVNWANQLS